MQAAAAHLTPVTLELGGKSPVIVDGQHCSNPYNVARRILHGKWLNCGQTCVAPDYVIVVDKEHSGNSGGRSFTNKLVANLRQTLLEFYGSEPEKSAHVGRIVSTNHTKRLASLIDECRKHITTGAIVLGGKYDIDEKYIEPTLVVNPPLGSKIMTEEIFGPILPIITVASVADAIAFVQNRDRPLALYIFSDHQKTINKILHETSSGGVGINGVGYQMTIPDCPFGGVGASGFGQYNGKHTFDRLSHQKTICQKPPSYIPDPPLMFPPLSDFAANVIDTFTRGPSLQAIETVEATGSFIGNFAAGFLAAALSHRIIQHFKK